MKIPPKNSRGRAILLALLPEPATFYQGIDRHGRMSISERAVRELYDQLEFDKCLVKTGNLYSVTIRAREILEPDEREEEEGVPVATAYRGNWQAGSLNAASARRAGAAFGLSWIRP